MARTIQSSIIMQQRCLQVEVARALGLTKDNAVWMAQETRQGKPKQTAVRRPGHKRRPFVAENEASPGDEVQEADDHLEDEVPDAKRQRTAEAAESPEAPGEHF